MIEILPQTQADLLAVKATDRLTTDDYETVFIPRLNDLIAQHGKARILLQLADDFHGWEPGAIWDDAKVGIQHRHDFLKVAVVTGQKWIDWSVKLGAHFMDGQVKTFDANKMDEALQWVQNRS
ncbi:MAG: STAS/SEC14 domain-containing protein [Myxococcota bacterium]